MRDARKMAKRRRRTSEFKSSNKNCRIGERRNRSGMPGRRGSVGNAEPLVEWRLEAARGWASRLVRKTGFIRLSQRSFRLFFSLSIPLIQCP